MRIDKISPNTPDKYIVGDFLKYFRLADEHIVLVQNSFGEVFPKETDYETINNLINHLFMEICCYDAEDRGEYWEFIEPEEEEDTEYDEEEDFKTVARVEEVMRIEEVIAKVLDTKEPQPFDELDAYEIDVEYLEEDNHNLFEAAVVLKYCNNPEKYFPIKDMYSSVSNVMKGEDDDILYLIAVQIYNYYYGEEDIEEEE